MIDLFENIKGVKKNQRHPKVRFLDTSEQVRAEKNILNEWTKGFVDRDNKFARQFQETFHSSFWEIYLYKLFAEAGFELDQSHQTPDFIIKKPYEVYVEAVTANIRSGGKPEEKRTPADQFSMLIPPHLQPDFLDVLNEGIIRGANAIQSKHRKYVEEYTSREWIHKSRPFIVAMASFDQINYGREFIYSMLALLYGMYYDNSQGIYCAKTTITKYNSNTEIPIGIFLNDHYEDISAVIFSCTLTLGKLTSMSISSGNYSFNNVINIRQELDSKRYLLHEVSLQCPEDIADGVFVFHNPNAKNKLPKEFFGSLAVTQFFLEDEDLKYSGNAIPIVARLNIPTILKATFQPHIHECIRQYNQLDAADFYE